MRRKSFARRVWWITLPVAVLMAVWILPALHTYKSFVLMHPEPYTDTPMDFRVILLSRISTLADKIRTAVLQRFLPRDEGGLDTVELRVPGGGLARLEARLPSSKNQWVRAQAHFPGEERFRKVRVRYRGDNLHHWGLPAKSWRVRLRREEALQGQRTFEIILPRWRAATAYYLPLRAAKMLHITSPEARFVKLEVNGRRHGGVHLLTESVDEGFLRRRSRLPGDVYVGDMVLDDGLPREQASSLTLWALPGAWQKAAENNKFEAGSIEPMRDLLDRLARNHDVVGHERLISRLDLPAWARLSAWQKLMAATHLDEGHNWLLYYDYAKETIEPILRDGNALTDDLMQVVGSAPGLDVSLTTPLLTALHRDHRFLRLKHRAVADFFADRQDQALLNELDQVAPRVASALQRSRQIDWLEMPEGKPLRYFTPVEFRERVRSYRAMLVSWFDRQRALAMLQPDNVRLRRTAPDRILVQINGYAPVEELALPVTGAAGTLSLCLRAATESPCAALDGLYAASDGTLRIQLPLFAAFRTEAKGPAQSGAYLIAEPGTYEIVIRGTTFDATRQAMARGYRNEPFPVREDGDIKLSRAQQAAYGIVPVRHPETRWRGEINVTHTMEFDGDLVVAPGTRVLLAPGANLFIRGRLIAEGTPGAPILFVRRDAAQPWGTVAVIGPRSDGTTVRHCLFEGGSGFKDRMRDYSGMVSIRNASDVVIESSTFSDNSRFDDTLHVVYSRVMMRDITIKNAHADAIDLDVTSAYIDGLRVSNSGNDGLDLMTSEVYLRDAQISGGGDKGVSVGEGSFLLLENALLANNKIGIEGKDGSQIYVRETMLKQNELSVSGYHKNLRYPGRVQMVLERTNVEAAEEQVRLLDGSELIYAPARGAEDARAISLLQGRAEQLKRNLGARSEGGRP